MHQPPREQQQPYAASEHNNSPKHVSSQVRTSAALAPIPPSFARRKKAILAQLAVPDDEYTDLSPKGTVDAGIRDLIDEINGLDGLVTTSSCAGRVSVFLEGRRAGHDGPVAADEGSLLLPGHHLAVEEGQGEEECGDQSRALKGQDGQGNEGTRGVAATAGVAKTEGMPSGGGDGGRDGPPAVASASAETVAGVGGKGGGGRWLFVSHEPVESRGKLDSEPNIVAALLGMEEPIFDGREGSSAEEMGESRLIHFKFEPMVRLPRCLYSALLSLCSCVHCPMLTRGSLRSYMSSPRPHSTPSSYFAAACKPVSAKAAPSTSSRRQRPATTHQQRQQRPSWRSAPWDWVWRA